MGKANFIDKDINALLLLQQQVRQPNFHKNRHQAISQIKQIIDTNLNTNKIQDSKYHEWQSQTKQKLKQHINLLESAETEEESKDCCDLLDDLVQSLIISGNFVNQPVQQQPQPIIVIVEDTTPDKPNQDQPTTIDIDQNDEIQPLDFGPDYLGDKEPSESETKHTDVQGKRTEKEKKGTQKKQRNKKQKYRTVIGDDGEEEEEAQNYEEESEYESETEAVDGQSNSNSHQAVDQDQDEDEGIVAKTGFPGKKASDQDHETSQIHQKDVQKQQDDDSYDSSYGEEYEDDEDGEGKKKRKRRQFEESSKRRKSSQRNEYESNEGGYYYSGERREGEGDDTLENGYSQEKPVYQKILTLEEEASQEKHAASSEEEEEVEETITKVTGTDESIDENEEFDDSKVVVEKSTTSSKSKKSSKQSKQKIVKEPPSFSEYGFGFWFRFLTKYPEVLEEGAKEPLYFISRLSINQEDGGEDNKEEKLGDNALLVHLGQESYEFVSCNSEGDDKSISQNIDHSGDIEGVWSYLYYSYSLAEKQAIAFLKIGDEDFKHIQLNVVHPKSKYVSLTVGGTDNNRLPGFNGLFLRIVVTHNEGAFISTPEKMDEYFQKQGPVPSFSISKLKSKEIQDDNVRKEPDDDVKYVTVGENKFVSEYAISGWYRFKQPENQEEWHNGYRIDTKQPSSDEVLGDRVFQYQIERDDGGKIWSTTYSYLNIKGEGKLSLPQNALHNDRHLKWHFVYQSYSRSTRKGIFHIKFSEDEEIFNWEDINHYYSQYFYIYLGKTYHQPGWSGEIAYVQFVYGPKAYIDNGDYEDSKDLFKFKLGSDKLEDDVKVDEQKDKDEEKDEEKDYDKDDNQDDNDEKDDSDQDDKNKAVDKDDKDKLSNKRKDKKHKHQGHDKDGDNSSKSSSESESESDDEGDDENEKERKQQEKQEKKDQKQKENQNQKQKEKKKETEDQKDKEKEKEKDIDQDIRRDIHGKDDKYDVDDDNHHKHPKDKADQNQNEQLKEKEEKKDYKKNDQDDDDDDNNYLIISEKGQRDDDIDGNKKGRQDKNDIYDSDTNQKNPIFDKEKSNDKFFETYGYGFWFRYLSTYPSRMLSGKNAPWYFISRLTSNNSYDNIRMNDRILAIWQGDGYYHFTTCNSNNGNVNQVQNNNYPADIEGLWTYIYYSYSANEQEAVALIKYGEQEFLVITHKTLHSKTKYLRFVLGGNDQGRYPGFNGQFTLVYFSTHNAFRRNAASLDENKNSAPSLFSRSTLNQNIIEEIVSRKTDDPASKFLTVGGGQNKFPSEYAFSGWFRWDKTTQHSWHNLFRVTIKNPSTDAYLGDRTLACWLGLESGGILHFPTYTYNNMIGGGNSNLFQNVKHENRHLDWFFIYFGYSKKISQAYVFVRWIESQNSLFYEKVNHYLVPEFYVYVGKDAHFPGFNGALAHISFNLGEGIFRKNDYEKQEKDVFQYNLGISKLFKENQGQEQKSEQQLESSFNQKQSSFEKVINSDAWITEYGYGFWLRFFTAYPQRLISGKNEAWYFVSRLTSMEPYDNIRMNDRRLAIWQGAGYYHFTTCNQQTGNVNQVINNNFPEDIEGLWTYVYYSYSEKAKKAIGLIKYGKGVFNIINHDTIHEKTKYVKFILGGNDNNRYPGFNGIFKSVTFSSKLGSFIASPEQLKPEVELPISEITELFNTKLIPNQLSRSTDDQPFYQVVGQVESQFPHEYAISGWYRWQPTAQQAWHNFFRVSIKQQSTDVYLGDRTLTMWLGLGFLHFPTYTYVNMVGGGNTNHHQNINHKDRHLQWFYVYFGYSKKVKQCYIHVKWTDSDDSMNYENINHYFVDEFYIFVGKDKFYPGLNGKLAYVNFNIGHGSYTKDFNHKDDAFAYQLGLQNLFGKKSDFNPNIVTSQILKNAYNQEAPILDNEQKAESEFEEYGYGFWLRFLTVYPVRLLAGKNEAWYFVARLTLNNPYDNIRVGDRLLAIWQGQGYYHFTTCNKVDNNPNYVQNINFPQDIEGLWTYIYYSYSADQNRAIAFIKYGDGELQSIAHKVTHPKTKYLRLIIGGNDQKRYPGFNGQFYNIAFTLKSGGFVEQSSQLAGYLNKNKAPELTSQLLTDVIIGEKQSRTFTQDFVQKTYQQPDPPTFSREYSVSGWFKWQQMPQHPWHNLFRVQIKQPATDAFLGDRTLCLWLGLGFLHLPTYTYDNMNGGGNTNWWQNIDHRERHTQWFYVYYGYSKIKEKAYVYVKWTNDDSSLSYERARHYYSHQYFIYVGKDPFYPGLNGQISQVRWNYGEGAFRETKDFTHENDIFGFASLKVQGVGKFDINDIQRDLIPSFQENKKGAILKSWEDLNGVKEYGYGFWLRFLTRYPNPLNRGLQHPWSIVARLSKNNDYQDIRVGDRTLSLWLGQGFYHFTTYDGGNPNANQNVNHPADIEGLWTFIHYSHSLEKKKSIAFIKFGNEQFSKRDIPATHTSPSILKFYLGMNDNIYVAFNGQFSNVYVSVGEGVYQETEEALINNIFKQLKKPENENSELKVREVIPKTKQFTPEIQPLEEVYDDGQLAAEYSWSGWFKWNPTDQREWHLIVRLSDLQNSENISFLGDRTLSAWVGRSNGGIIHLSTYTYHDLRGNGNPDLWKQIQYQQDLTKWHFIYFGYSKLQRQAYAAVQFLNRAPNHEWKDVNHYLPGKLSLYVAKDKWHSTYSGNIGYLRLNTGLESFTREYQKQSQDIFGFTIGKQELSVGSFIQIQQPVFNKIQDSSEQTKETVNKQFLSYNKKLSE